MVLEVHHSYVSGWSRRVAPQAPRWMALTGCTTGTSVIIAPSGCAMGTSVGDRTRGGGGGGDLQSTAQQ